MAGGEGFPAAGPAADVRTERAHGLAVHAVVGAVWLYALSRLLGGAGAVGSVWIASAVLLWVVGAAELRNGAHLPGRVTAGWWLRTLAAPLFAWIELVRLLARRLGPPDRSEEVGPVRVDTATRLAALEAALASTRTSFERRVTELEQELREVRALAGIDAEPEAAVPAAAPPRSRPAPPAPPPPRIVTPPPARALPAEPARPVRPPRREVDVAELLGARALAWAGGVVTLLGVVFFFVLAVDRGWIGPVERVGLGALASAALLGAGVVARRRYGDVHSALAAAGSGIAGGYATLLAAAALYGLVGDLPALLVAAAIAAAGAAVALRWRSQLLASLGLVGATLLPLTLLLEGGLSVLGTGFVALVFAATAVVAVSRDWRRLLAVGLGASALQIAVLVAQTGERGPGAVLVLAYAFGVLYVAAGLALERRGARPLERLATTLVLASAALVGTASRALLDGAAGGVDRQGLALLVAGCAYGALAALLFRRQRSRDASALLGAIALALAALGFADLLTGTSLAAAWAAQAAVLAWLGARIGDARYRLLSLAYLVLAAAYALAVTAPPQDLLTAVAAPAAGVGSLLAVAAAALVVARYGRDWERVAGPGPVSVTLDGLVRLAHVWRSAALVLASVLGVHALSLAVLETVQALGVRPAFSWGHVAVTGAWAAGGGIALLAGLASGRRPLQAGGLAWLAAGLLKVGLFDVASLPARHAAWSALALAVGYSATAYGVALLRSRTREDVRLCSYGATVAGGGLVLGAAVVLLPRGGTFDPLGAGLLGAATAFAVLGATLLPRPGRRNAATAFWGVGVALGTIASTLLVGPLTPLVGVWAAAAAALAALGAALGERRLLLAAWLPAGLALGLTLLRLAPPTDLFVPATGAADGVPALVLATASLAVLAAACRRLTAPAEDGLDEALDRLGERLVRRSAATLSLLGVYGLSLAILGLAQLLGGGDVTTDFQRGHTAVSAFWGVVGLLALRFGLTRGRAALKLAGFALFGVALAKLFLYDLTTLSSVTRALSFLAVGAVLLLAGFFHQRLGARAAEVP